MRIYLNITIRPSFFMNYLSLESLKNFDMVFKLSSNLCASWLASVISVYKTEGFSFGPCAFPNAEID